MKLEDLDNLDPKFSEIVVLINANHQAVTFSDAALVGKDFVLHPVQQNSNDRILRGASYTAANGTFTVPALTTAVFVVERPYVAPQPITQQAGKMSKPASIAVGAAFLLLVAGLVYLILRKIVKRR